MSPEENKAIVRRYLLGDPEAGRDNVDVWDEVCDPEIAMIGGIGFGEVHGLENLKQYTPHYHQLASREIAIDAVIAEGDRVAVSYTMHMSIHAPLTLPMGVAVPAGTTLTMTGVSIVTLRAGKVIEEKAWADWLSVMQQLGVMPAGDVQSHG